MTAPKKKGNPYRAPKKRARQRRPKLAVHDDPRRLVEHRELQALRAGPRSVGERIEKLHAALVEFPVDVGAPRGRRGGASLFDVAPRLARAHRAARIERERGVLASPAGNTTVRLRVLALWRDVVRCPECGGREDRIRVRVRVSGGPRDGRRAYFVVLDCGCGARRVIEP